MVRTARWFVVSVVSLAVIGLAGVSSACDSAKAADTASADAKAGCASKVSAVTADAKAGCASKANVALAGAGCSAKKALANADCGACNFMAELKANKGKVVVSTVNSDEGVTLVFAAVTKDDVAVAKEVASHAFSLMSAPAKCEYTRTQMTEKSCDGCKSGFAAIADAKVSLEETESGAETIVVTKDEKQVEQLQTFFASLYVQDEKGE